MSCVLLNGSEVSINKAYTLTLRLVHLEHEACHAELNGSLYCRTCPLIAKCTQTLNGTGVRVTLNPPSILCPTFCRSSIVKRKAALQSKADASAKRTVAEVREPASETNQPLRPCHIVFSCSCANATTTETCLRTKNLNYRWL